MSLVRITEGLVLSNIGIKSIKLVTDRGEPEIEVSYITGYSEFVSAEQCSMEELLEKLGRNPRNPKRA